VLGAVRCVVCVIKYVFLVVWLEFFIVFIWWFV